MIAYILYLINITTNITSSSIYNQGNKERTPGALIIISLQARLLKEDLDYELSYLPAVLSVDSSTAATSAIVLKTCNKCSYIYIYDKVNNNK